MYVITFTNPKGGTGKTTAAMLLAEQIYGAGRKVGVLDVDPNKNFVFWSQARRDAGKEPPFPVYPRPDSDQMVEFIDGLSDSLDFLIIDLEGTKDQIVTYALARSDLCVIPMEGTALEARQAANAVQLVRTTSKAMRTEIKFVVLFTKMNAALQTADEQAVRNQMQQHDIPVLKTRLVRRAPFTAIFRDNKLLREILMETQERVRNSTASVKQQKMKQIQTASQNASDYAQDIIDTLIGDAA